MPKGHELGLTLYKGWQAYEPNFQYILIKLNDYFSLKFLIIPESKSTVNTISISPRMISPIKALL